MAEEPTYRPMSKSERRRTEGTSAARRRAARKQRAMGPLERESVKGTTASERKALRTESPEKTISRAVAGDKPVTPALARQVLSNLAIVESADKDFEKRSAAAGPLGLTRLSDKPEVDKAQSFFKKSFVRPTALESRGDASFRRANIRKLKQAAESYLASGARANAAKKRVSAPKGTP